MGLDTVEVKVTHGVNVCKLDVMWAKRNPCVPPILHHLTSTSTCTHVPTSNRILYKQAHFHAFPARLSIVLIPWSSSLFLCLHAVCLLWSYEGFSLTPSPIFIHSAQFKCKRCSWKLPLVISIHLLYLACFYLSVCFIVLVKVLPTGWRCSHEHVHMNASFFTRCWQYGCGTVGGLCFIFGFPTRLGIL